MATKSTPSAPTKQAVFSKPPKGYQNESVSVPVRESGDGAEFAAAVARKLTRPEVGAAALIEQWQKDTHDVNELVSELARQVDAVNGGDLRRAEGMLIAQAHSLNEVFNNLARRAMKQEYLKQWEAYMRMAMKAQNQCRMTLETLATIKNPPVVFARQANIINGGQQQVNNGTQVEASRAHAHFAHAGAHAANTSVEQTGLLEAGDGQWLDTRAAGTAGGADPRLVPVGAIDRPAHG